MDTDDGTLIERSVRGRPDAFVKIVQRHEAAVHAFLARRAGRQPADDLLGEVWVRAFAARGGYDPGHGDARPWLYGIARNVLREHWRSRPDPACAAVPESVDPWDDVVTRLDSAAQAQALVSALRALPEPERDVLLLIAWEQRGSRVCDMTSWRDVDVGFSLDLSRPGADAGRVQEDGERLERWMRAVRAKDARFDGWFFTGVVTTGIYCRPSCPVVPPRPENMRFFPSAAAAQQAGLRACKRCRPDASPGSPEWNERADLVARAMRLIADGVIDRDGVPGLAARLGYSVRQLERQLLAELGAGPLALARAQRAQTARLLIETSGLPMGDVAFAAGFASIRTFNDTVREVFALSPTELRRRAGRGQAAAAPGALSLRLPFRAPLFGGNLFGHLAATAVPGVEEWRNGGYRRTLRLPHGHGIVALRPGPEYIACQLSLTDLRDLAIAISRCRRLLDLDADPVAMGDLLREDAVLAPLVQKAPGRRVPRTVDAAEFAARVVLGQQVSTAAARTHAARLVIAHGEPVGDRSGGLTHLFPAMTALASADPAALAVPRVRRETFAALTGALARGDIDLGPGSDWQRARAALTALPGLGPWSVETIAMRGLGDPDAFTAGDLGVRAAARQLGLPGTPAALTRRAAAWRPWRAYAVQYLWATGGHAINRIPADGPAAGRPDRMPRQPGAAT